MQFTSWLDFGGSPIFWWLIGHITFGYLTLWLLLRKTPIPELLFWVICFVVSGFMRLPALLFNLPLNPDESQMLAQGLTLTVDPLVYRSVDPTTSGPINSYLLSLIHLLGFQLDFRVTHILSWLITLTSIYFLYKALKYIFPKYISQVAIIPTVAFFNFTQNPDYINYYSEGIANILLSYGICQIARWTNYKKITYPELVGFGIALALIVLCKMQALPLAFVLGVWGLGLLYMFQQNNWLTYASVLSMSVISVWGSWLLYMYLNGLLNDFFLYYITANAQLKMHFSDKSYRSAWYLFIRFPKIIFKRGIDLNYWFFPFLALGVAFIATHFSKTAIKKMILKNNYFWVGLTAYFAMVVAVIIRTGSFFPHHFLYFLLPCSLFTGFFIHQLSAFSSHWRWLSLSTQLIFMLIGLLHIVNNEDINMYKTAHSRQKEMSSISKAILTFAKPGDYLAVWGWSCEYYVETQMPQGINENHSVRAAMQHPLQKAYYDRYIRDLQRTRPKVFVDAMTSRTRWMRDPKKYGHQNYPELAKFVADNYVFKAEIDSVKIYVAR